MTMVRLLVFFIGLVTCSALAQTGGPRTRPELGQAGSQAGAKPARTAGGRRP